MEIFAKNKADCGKMIHSEFLNKGCVLRFLHNTLSLRGKVRDGFVAYLIWDDYTPKQSFCSELAAKPEYEDCFVTSPMRNSMNMTAFQTHLKDVTTQKLNFRTCYGGAKRTSVFALIQKQFHRMTYALAVYALLCSNALRRF
jgi:hypothetical protein